MNAEGLHPAPAGFFEHGMTAGGAIKLRGHVPSHEAALGPLLTGIVGIALFGLSLQHAAAALRAPARHPLHNGLGVLALRIAGASHKAAKAAHFDHHIPAAQLTNLIGFLIGHLQPGVLQGFFRFLHLLVEALVEVPQDVLPVPLALFHLVQAVFHVGGKLNVNDVVEPVHHEAVDHLSQGSGSQPLVLLNDIDPVLDGGDDGGIGRGATDPLLLHGLDQHGLGVPGRRLGKVLLFVQGPDGGLVALLEIRQRRTGRLPFLVLPLLVHCNEAGEAETLVGGFELMPGTFRVNGHRIVHGVCHLGGQKTAPDQLIQSVLVLGQRGLDLLRVQLHMGGADGLVRVLRPRLRLKLVGLAIIVWLAIPVADELSGGLHRLFRQAQGIGTHVRNETQGPLSVHVHALIELLGNGHGPFGRHIQLPGGLLLEGGGGKGRRGIPLFLRFFDPGHGKELAGDVGNDLVHLSLIGQLPLFSLPVVPGHKGAGLSQPVQGHIQRPVLPGNKGPDLILPVHHKPGGHRLDPPGRQTPPDLLPQQGAQLIAHNPVQDAPGLLRIHQVIVNVPGIGNGAGHHILGDLVEGHPADFGVRKVQQLLQVPGNGLPLPVRVRCQIDQLRVVRAFLQIVNDLFLAGYRAIIWLKVVLQIHTHFALGQVPQVAHTCLHRIIGTQIFSNGLRLGRRFHNHQICRRFLCHEILHATALCPASGQESKICLGAAPPIP